MGPHGEDDEYYDDPANRMREGAHTPPTPATPSIANTPRDQTGFSAVDNTGRDTPRTPLSQDEHGIPSPPAGDDDGTVLGDRSYVHDGPSERMAISSPPPRSGLTTGAERPHTSRTTESPPPRTGQSMDWMREIDELITPGRERLGTVSTRQGTGWASRAGLDDLGDLSGLTAEQADARAALRTRQLLRTSRGDSTMSVDLNQTAMSSLLAAFDEMVLKAFRDSDDFEAVLKRDAFWKEVDELEAKLQQEEDLTRLEVKVQIEIDQLDREMKEEMAKLESIMSDSFQMPEGEPVSPVEDDAESDLYRTNPKLRQAILRQRYAKYRLYAQGVAEMQHEHNLDPSKYLMFGEEGEGGESGFSSGARALWKRKMQDYHVKRQRDAEKYGAFIPGQGRPPNALDGQKVQFVGPIFGHKKPPSVIDESSISSNAESSPREEEFVPGQRWKPPPMPELRPPPPKMPTRKDLTYASWARPGQIAKDTSNAAKKKFLEMHLPKKKEEGVPTPPSMPGAMRAPPMPGDDIPSHKLKMEGLPRNCTEDMVLEWMGEHAQNVNQNYNNALESYKRGIAIYKGQDGWLTGFGAIKFLNKPACLRALAALDRKRMGTRVIYLDYVIEKVLPPRGRLMLVNLHRKTTSKDLEKWLRGWHLATKEDNQDPELLQDEEGFNTGEAILTFEDVESADNCLAKFPWSQQLHGMLIGVKPMAPVRYDDVDEKWFEALDFANSTKFLLAESPDLDFVNRPPTPSDKALHGRFMGSSPVR